MKKFLLPVLLIFIITSICAQKSSNYKVLVVAFYNLENYYDTTDNPAVNDDDFTPKGVKQYTSAIYLRIALLIYISSFGTIYISRLNIFTSGLTDRRAHV